MDIKTLPTAFPWYIKKSLQNRFRLNAKPYEWGLITPKNSLLPFEFYYPDSYTDSGGTVTLTSDPQEWLIFDINDNMVATLSAASIALIRKSTKENNQYFYFSSDALTVSGGGALSLSPGLYYSRIKLGPDPGTLYDYFYSEVFLVPECQFTTATAPDQIPFLRLEWYNDSDIRPIFYNDISAGLPRFRNVVYLDTFIHQSEPEIIQDGEKDGNDEVVPIFQKCLLRYSLTEYVPDFLKLAFVIMQMHDHVLLTTENANRSFEVSKIVSVNTSPDMGGAFSTVEILFEEIAAITKKGCADNMA
jgi:hypothetical protein